MNHIEKDVKSDNCLIEEQNKRLRCHKLLYLLWVLIMVFYSWVNAYTRYETDENKDNYRSCDAFANEQLLSGFHLGFDLIVVIWMIYVISIDHIIVFFVLIIYSSGIAYVSYIKFQYMYQDATFYVVLFTIACVFGSYVKLLNSKTFFFNEK